MRISSAEQEAIKTVISLGCQFGFGNMIGHLQTAWSRQLQKDYGMKPRDDIMSASMQDDLINNGEWDETGERYMVQ